MIILCCAVLAGFGFLVLRSGADRPGSQLSEALDQTLASGARYTAVAHFEPATIDPVSHRYDGFTEPGTSADEFTDQRAVLRNLYVVEDIRMLGAEVIAGTTTTHYAAVVDLEQQGEMSAELAKEAGWGEREPVTDIHDRSPEIDVWVDGSGLIRRFYISESFGDGQLLASTTIDFYDFGAR